MNGIDSPFVDRMSGKGESERVAAKIPTAE
jgi:hypothetical protein